MNPAHEETDARASSTRVSACMGSSEVCAHPEWHGFDHAAKCIPQPSAGALHRSSNRGLDDASVGTQQRFLMHRTAA